MDDNTETCKHGPCDCMAREDSEFCSEACKQAHQNGETTCPCPHEGCGDHDHDDE